MVKRVSTSTFGLEFEKYVRMRRAGLPDGALRSAFQRDGIEPPPGFFDSSPAPAAAAAVAAAAVVVVAPTTPQRSNGHVDAHPAAPNFLAGIRDAKTSSTLRHVDKDANGGASATSGAGKPSSGGSMLDAISGFNRANLKHKDSSEVSEGNADEGAGTGMMGMLAGFDKTRLRSASTPMKRSDADRRATIASQGKQTLHEAMAAKIEALRSQIADSDEEDDEFDEDDTWEF
jgi:hypothetical protein